MSSQPTIKKGSKGSAVTLCQQRLLSKGFGLKADGDFGPGTEDAVEQFQASCGIQADGIVGPMTWNFLMSEGSASTPVDVLDEAKKELLGMIPTDANPQASKVLEAAIGKLGAKEIPNGSNGGPELSDIVGGNGEAPSAYYLYWGVKDPETLKSMPPWCVLFVCYSMKKGLGAATWKDIPFGTWYGGCSQVEEWSKKHGKWVASVTGTVPAGAAFTISRGQSGSDPSSSPRAGHIGLIVCDNGDGTVTTIEGNVSSKVGKCKRKKSELRGFVAWW